MFENSNELDEGQIDNQYGIPSRIVRYFRRKLVQENGLVELFQCEDIHLIRNDFRSFSNNLSRSFWIDLEKYDLADENRILTDKGLKIFIEIASIL